MKRILTNGQNDSICDKGLNSVESSGLKLKVLDGGICSWRLSLMFWNGFTHMDKDYSYPVKVNPVAQCAKELSSFAHCLQIPEFKAQLSWEFLVQQEHFSVLILGFLAPVTLYGEQLLPFILQSTNSLVIHVYISKKKNVLYDMTKKKLSNHELISFWHKEHQMKKPDWLDIPSFKLKCDVFFFKKKKASKWRLFSKNWVRFKLASLQSDVYFPKSEGVLSYLPS